MNRKGQALVEFVLILPIFILILFAIIDFGIIFNTKNELENASVDIVSMIKNNDDINDIKKIYGEYSINVNSNSKYITVVIKDEVNIMTPGLNLILENPYEVKVERTIPNVETE